MLTEFTYELLLLAINSKLQLDNQLSVRVLKNAMYIVCCHEHLNVIFQMCFLQLTKKSLTLIKMTILCSNMYKLVHSSPLVIIPSQITSSDFATLNSRCISLKLKSQSQKENRTTRCKKHEDLQKNHTPM